MFSHIVIGANDIDASKTFYDALFQTIGGNAGMADGAGPVIYMHNGGMLMVTKPIDGEPACPANGGTIGFTIASPEQVDAWHSAGCAAGGMTCEDAPGVREGGFGKLYLAYLRDPAGNKLCGVYRVG